MNIFQKVNEVTIEGNVSSIDIKSNHNGHFESISVAVDNSYKDKNSGNLIEDTAFVNVKVGDKLLNKFKTQLNTGDRVRLSGKLVMDTWNDKNTQEKKSALKVQALRVEMHLPKAAKELLKANGFINSNQNAPQQNAPQQNNQPQGGYQNNQPQGGFQNNQPQGGYQNQQPQGGYPQQNNNFQRQGSPMGNQRPN